MRKQQIKDSFIAHSPIWSLKVILLQEITFNTSLCFKSIWSVTRQTGYVISGSLCTLFAFALKTLLRQHDCSRHNRITAASIAAPPKPPRRHRFPLLSINGFDCERQSPKQDGIVSPFLSSEKKTFASEFNRRRQGRSRLSSSHGSYKQL